jgi:hypothetical protein
LATSSSPLPTSEASFGFEKYFCPNKQNIFSQNSREVIGQIKITAFENFGSSIWRAGSNKTQTQDQSSKCRNLLYHRGTIGFVFAASHSL